jgi:hypothetical protein
MLLGSRSLVASLQRQSLWLCNCKPGLSKGGPAISEFKTAGEPAVYGCLVVQTYSPTSSPVVAF